MNILIVCFLLLHLFLFKFKFFCFACLFSSLGSAWTNVKIFSCMKQFLLGFYVEIFVYFFTEILCPNLNHLSHGIITRTNAANTNGTTASYECDEGYSLIGQSVLKCVLGTWSHEQPLCTGKMN